MDRTQYYFDMYKTLLLLENSIERIIDNKHIRQSNIRLSKKLVDEFFEIIKPNSYFGLDTSIQFPEILL